MVISPVPQVLHQAGDSLSRCSCPCSLLVTPVPVPTLPTMPQMALPLKAQSWLLIRLGKRLARASLRIPLHSLAMKILLLTIGGQVVLFAVLALHNANLIEESLTEPFKLRVESLKPLFNLALASLLVNGDYAALAERIRLLVLDGRIALDTRLPAERDALEVERLRVAHAAEVARPGEPQAAGRLAREQRGRRARLPRGEEAEGRWDKEGGRW